MARLFTAKIDNVPPLDPPASSGAGLGEKIETTFTRFIQRVFRWGYDVTGELFVNIFDASMKILKPGMVRMFQELGDRAYSSEAVPEEYRRMWSKVKAETGESGVLGMALAILPTIYGLITGVFSAFADRERHAAEMFIQSHIPSLMELSQFHRLGLIDDVVYKQFRAQNGVRPEVIAAYEEMSRQVPDITALITARWRGVIGDDKFAEEIKRQGYNDEGVKIFDEISKQIPPIGDLIRFLVREAFNDQTVQQFGYDEDYPDSLNPYLKKLGYDADWGKKYWRAHWTLPSPTQAYEMLHRGEIDIETMKALLKTADYPPFWRDKLVNISYNLLTRVDIRRLLQAGTISYDDALAEYKRIGYDEQKAQWLTDFAARGVSEKEKDLTRADVVNMYEDGITDRDATAQALVKLGYDSQEAEDILKLSDVAIAKAQRTDAINYVKERYAAKQIERAQASNELAQIGLKTNSVERYLLAWDRAATTSDKVPSMADAKRWYLKDYIDEVKYREFVKLNGYNQSNIELYVREANDLKQEQATQ